MLATSPTHDTTERVTVPYLTGAQWDELASRLLAQHPAEAVRIERAVLVLLRREVREASEVGSYLIQSSEEPNLYHLASSFTCTCPDRRQRDVRCKHMWAVVLLTTASAIARRESWERRYAECQQAWRAAEERACQRRCGVSLAEAEDVDDGRARGRRKQLDRRAQGRRLAAPVEVA